MTVGDANVKSPVFVTNAPPEPMVKFNVPPAVVVNMLAPEAPIAFVVAVPTARLITPLVPTFKAVPAVCVNALATLAPLLVTEIVPPEPVAISLNAILPVPDPPELSVIATALDVMFVVVIELPAFIVKPFAPLPDEFAFIVTAPDPVLIAAAKVTADVAFIKKLPLIEVTVAPKFCVKLPEFVVVNVIFPLPVCNVSFAPNVNPVEPTKVKFPLVVVKFPVVVNVLPWLSKSRLLVPVVIEVAAANVNLTDVKIVNGLFVASVGDANVMLPVSFINAPPVPAVNVKVPPDEVVRIFCPLVPILLLPAVGTANVMSPVFAFSVLLLPL